MIKRIIVAGLILALLSLSTAGLCEDGMSAGEALFGPGNYGTQLEGGATDADMYGADDTASASNYPTLRLGDSDSSDGVAYIVFLQNRLIELGYLNDDADGTYGANTEVAVREFQKNNGLQATGIADPYTQEMVYSNNPGIVAATVDNTVFGSDVYTIKNSQHQPVGISKDTAWNLREESEKLWKSKYADSADFIGYAREWKQTLADKHGIDWDGSLGDYKFQLWD